MINQNQTEPYFGVTTPIFIEALYLTVIDSILNQFFFHCLDEESCDDKESFNKHYENRYGVRALNLTTLPYKFKIVDTKAFMDYVDQYCCSIKYECEIIK